jgi:hypothetical protein
MKCQQSQASRSNTSFVKCECEAAEICWCPTWINISQKEAGTLAFGPRPNTTINRMPATPIYLCTEHAQNFKPEFNPNAKAGTFYWGEEANTQYVAACERFKLGTNIV